MLVPPSCGCYLAASSSYRSQCDQSFRRPNYNLSSSLSIQAKSIWVQYNTWSKWPKFNTQDLNPHTCLGFWILHHGYRIDFKYWTPDSLSYQWNVDSGCQLRQRIPDSLSCIPFHAVLNSGSHSKNFSDSGFQIYTWGEVMIDPVRSRLLIDY